MRDLRIDYMNLRTFEEGTTVLSVQVAKPADALAVSIFAHDPIDVAWRAGIQLQPTDSPLVWRSAWTLDPELPDLLEVANINDTNPSWSPIKVSERRWVFLRPDTGFGEWIAGERAHTELSRIELLREQRYTTPLRAPGSPPGGQQFLILAIADNLLITQPQRVPGISLRPMQSDLGDDARTVLTHMLRERNIISSAQSIPKDQWLKQVRQLRPAVQIECYVQAVNADTARDFGRETIERLLNMLTLSRGAAARLIGGVMLVVDGDGHHRYHGAWIEHGGYRENLLGGIIAGENVHALQKSWEGLQGSPRAQLWVALYAAAVRDPRWDYQLFRCFNLLESIADTVVPPNVVITNEAGHSRKFRNSNGTFTTRQAQGKVYMLLLQLAGAEADDQLWKEVGQWVLVRNDVAHDGEWQRPHSNETFEHAAIQTAIAGSGHDGTFESGTKPFVDRIRESVERTLYAAINGNL